MENNMEGMEDECFNLESESCECDTDYSETSSDVSFIDNVLSNIFGTLQMESEEYIEYDDNDTGIFINGIIDNIYLNM